MWQIEEYYAYEYDFSVSVPNNARFMSIRSQDGQHFVAFLLDNSRPRTSRTLYVTWQGQYHPHDPHKMTYLGWFKPGEGKAPCYLFDSLPPSGPLELLAECGAP
jgi:hypothetical protein